MKFIIKNNLIVSTMKAALGLITPRAPFNLVRVTADHNGVHINCTNTRTSFSATIPAAVNIPGVACVEISTAYNILSKLPKDSESTVELVTGDKNELTLSQRRRNYKLPVSDTDPEIFKTAQFPVGETFLDEQGEISAAIAKVKPFVASEEAMEGISCILLRGENNGLSIVGLNGHQFCHVKMETDFTSILDGDILLGLKGLVDIKGWLFNSKAVEFAADKKRLFLRKEIDGVVTTFSLLRSSYEYPNYVNFESSIEGCENPAKLICDRVEMLDALNRLSVFTTENNRTIQFKHNPASGEFNMTSVGSESGNGVEPLEVAVEGPMPNISFPTIGLTSILNTFESSKVILTITGSERPCRIEGMDEIDKTTSTILMPMMVQEETYYSEDETNEKAA